MDDTVDLAEYLFTSLRQIGGAGALATSFGVGELSALNAVAGAYAEKVPVVHIVGGPSRAARAARACLHHSLGDGDLGVFAAMYAAVTVAQARLDCPATAPRLVDEVLRACLVESRPVYIELPSDMAAAQVPRPTMPAAIFPSTTSEELYACRAHILCFMIAEAERPMILVDGFTARFDIREEINELVRISQIPTLTTPFGKGIVNETLPGYKGIFCGAMGNKELQDWVDGCDLVLHFGPLRSDVNTFGFSARTNASKTLFFEKNAVEHDDSTNLLLLNEVSATKLLVQNLPMDLLKELPAPTSSSPVDQQTFWLRVSRLFRPGDIILTETGTASYGGQSFVLPENTILINSSLWLSIGYTLAAAQGAALAQREMFQAGDRPHGRTILFEGEGSLQMSAQAISDMIRNRLDVIIFVINNGGYTIERLIHGFSASYNDVQPWRNLEAPSFFGAPRDDLLYPVRTRRVQIWGDLESVMQDLGIQSGKGMNVIEVFMDAADAPQSLKNIADYVRKENKADTANGCQTEAEDSQDSDISC
ncbi:pyruvate decarboxylase [Verticillium dahliae]|nr:pyruvate decarboxylase [Verticillium dahliae]